MSHGHIKVWKNENQHSCVTVKCFGYIPLFRYLTFITTGKQSDLCKRAKIMLTAAGSDERRMMNIVLVRSESGLLQRSESGPLSSRAI